MTQKIQQKILYHFFNTLFQTKLTLKGCPHRLDFGFRPGLIRLSSQNDHTFGIGPFLIFVQELIIKPIQVVLYQYVLSFRAIKLELRRFQKPKCKRFRHSFYNEVILLEKRIFGDRQNSYQPVHFKFQDIQSNEEKLHF